MKATNRNVTLYPAEREIVNRYAARIMPAGSKPNFSSTLRVIIHEWWVVEGRQKLTEMEAVEDITSCE